MTDINSKNNQAAAVIAEGSPVIEHLGKQQESILTLMELFYFAYRDFTGDGDEVLAKIGFGRAHHRVIHFVHHYPGLRVADLLNILKITKQSLARVLKQLIEEHYIRQTAGKKDRRERLLFTTEQGNALAKQLAAPQIERFKAAIQPLMGHEQQIVEKFLFSLIEQHHRPEVNMLMAQNGHAPKFDCINLDQTDK